MCRKSIHNVTWPQERRSALTRKRRQFTQYIDANIRMSRLSLLRWLRNLRARVVPSAQAAVPRDHSTTDHGRASICHHSFAVHKRMRRGARFHGVRLLARRFSTSSHGITITDNVTAATAEIEPRSAATTAVQRADGHRSIRRRSSLSC